MRKNILVLLALLVMSVSLDFHFTASSAQTIAEQQAQSGVEQEASRLYSTLSSLSINDRKTLYKGLTPELKSELWKVQLRSYLSKHSDLTDKQREAIEGAIAFITPQLFKIPQDSPDWEEKVDKPVQLLTKRILEVFPREVARELLTILGGPEPLVSLDLRRINSGLGLINSGCGRATQEANLGLNKKQPLIFRLISGSFAQVSCDCSRRSDWCLQEQECIISNCEQNCCCGFFYLYTCNGECALIIYV